MFSGMGMSLSLGRLVLSFYLFGMLKVFFFGKFVASFVEFWFQVAVTIFAFSLCSIILGEDMIW